MAYNPRGRAPPAQAPANTYGPHEMMNLLATANAATEDHLFAVADYVTRQAASDPIVTETSLGRRQFMLLNIKGFLTAKLGAFMARAGPSDFMDLEFLGRRMEPQVYAVRQDLDMEHRQAFINAYRRQHSTDANRVARMKHAFGVP
ncbi:hypothetical protein BDW62DRAFT_201904 [Aspergillus aurantiobrunneus]